jgi:carbon-monoxide dehydrogenase medium subunit
MPLRGLYRPRTVDEAVALLARDDDAKPLAGGTTLVAKMNARVVEPNALVSLAGIGELQGMSVLPDGRARIGAFTRHRDIAACQLTLGCAKVVAHAAAQIANAVVRNMGTIGGAIVSASPGMDYPPALVAAGAAIEIASMLGRSSVPAREFFVGWHATALRPDEIVTAVLLPMTVGEGCYVKYARTAGDYATASVAACLGAQGACRVAVGACGPVPLADDGVDLLLSSDRSDAALAEAGRQLAALADPLSDVRGSADYRRQLIPGLLVRAVRAVEAAGRGTE